MLTSVAFAANTSVVEYTEVTEEGVTTVTATAIANGAEDEVKLFTAVYNEDGSFAGAKKASTKDSALLKNSVTLGAGQTVKSFTWEGDENTPIEAVATYGKVFTEADVEITFGGKSFEEYIGSALAFDDEDSVAEYTVKLGESNIGSDGNITIPYPEVSLKDNGMYYDVAIDEEAYTTTIRIMSGRTVTYDDTYTSKAKETYAPQYCETIVISYEMAMFTEDMILNEGSITFNANYNAYDNIYTYQFAETVANSAAIDGKTAVLSAISVDGVAVEGFSPDVFEYTVTVPASQVKMPKVTFVAAGNAKATKEDTLEVPGKTVITVTEGDAVNTYTINYAFANEAFATNVTIKDSTITELYRSFYEPGGMQVGTKVYVDRQSTTNYDIKEINDTSLTGADLIRGSIDCYGSKNSIYEGEAIPDWISFDAARGVKVVVLDTLNVGRTNFEDNGYTYATNSKGFIKTYTNAEKVFTVSYTKHFDANTTVTIPNVAANATHTILVALIWDDWSPLATDITLTADNFSKATIVVLVPKDKGQDVILAKDENGVYSAPVWTEDKTYGVDAYDYETDSEGNIVYNAYDASRATGRRSNATIATTTAAGNAVTTQAFKQLTSNDGHYVFGSMVATDRYPNSGNRMSITRIDEEYEGSNGIVFAFGAKTAPIVNFSVNDNLDKIVVMSLDAITNLKANDNDVFVHSVPSVPAYYKYQGVGGGKGAMAEFTMSYNIAKGNMYDYDIITQTTSSVKPEGYTYYIRRNSVADYLTDNVISPNPEAMSEELYTYATTYKRDGWKDHKWFLGDVIFEDKTDLVTDLTYVGPSTPQVPRIIDFTIAAYSDRVENVTSETGNKAGEPLSYPLWLEPKNATYIAGAYVWTSLPGTSEASKAFQSTETVTDWYTFKVTEDAVVMYFSCDLTKNFWGTEEAGWKKISLKGEDRIDICRTKTNSARFTYNNLYVKEVKAGETVTIKNAMATNHIPLVFVKRAN